MVDQTHAIEAEAGLDDASVALDLLGSIDHGILLFDLDADGCEVLRRFNGAASRCLELPDGTLHEGMKRETLVAISVARGDVAANFSAASYLERLLRDEETTRLVRLPSGRRLRLVSRRRRQGGSLVLCIEMPATPRTSARQDAAPPRAPDADYFTVLESTPAGIVRADAEGRADYANPASLDLFELGDADDGETAAVDPDILRRLSPVDGRALTWHIANSKRFEAEIALPYHTRHVMISVSDLVGGGAAPTRILSLTDITPLKEARSRIEFLARHDALTGLGNRTQLKSVWDQVEPRIAHDGLAVHMLALDLDHFKRVNDEYGHGIGDLLLREVAGRLRRCVGSGPHVFRFGGDEFIVLLDGGSRREAVETAERIVASLADPFDIAGHLVHVGCSVGIASAPLDGVSRDQIHRAADLALYVVKRDGRNGVACFDPVHEQAMIERRLLQTDLALAIANEDFHLVFQRQVGAASGATRGMEAFVRWHNRRLGRLVPPEEFIPIAEQSGLVGLIDLWTVRHAVEKLACIVDAGWETPLLAINLSSQTLARDDIPELIGRVLAEHGVEPRSIEIEISEGVAAAETQALTDVLTRLRAMGIKVTIDDFALGQTGFSYLQTLPVERLKLDPSIVRRLGGAEGSDLIVASIWDLCQRLGLSLTAEGVETAEQWSALQAIGAIEGQGYFLGHPELADDVIARIREARGAQQA